MPPRALSFQPSPSAADKFGLSGPDCVAAFVSYRSTHTGSFMGHPPTGNVVRVTGMDIMRYRDGQVIELWSQFDDLGLLQQIGIVPLRTSTTGTDS